MSSPANRQAPFDHCPTWPPVRGRCAAVREFFLRARSKFSAPAVARISSPSADQSAGASARSCARRRRACKTVLHEGRKAERASRIRHESDIEIPGGCRARNSEQAVQIRSHIWLHDGFSEKSLPSVAAQNFESLQTNHLIICPYRS